MQSVAAGNAAIGIHEQEAKQRDQAVRNLFPDNIYVQRLLGKAASLHVFFLDSQVKEQWLYHPDYRTLCVWLPDLEDSSLSYVVIMLAHELGHVVDFDIKPHYLAAIQNVPWFAVPIEIELSAFLTGFQIIRELDIPVTLAQYCQMIEPPMGKLVAQVAIGDRTLKDVVSLLGQAPVALAKQAV